MKLLFASIGIFAFVLLALNIIWHFGGIYVNAILYFLLVGLLIYYRIQLYYSRKQMIIEYLNLPETERSDYLLTVFDTDKERAAFLAETKRIA